MFFKKKNECKKEREIRFFKVPYEQFKEDWEKLYGEINLNILECIYDNIKLPVRGTTESAGYDFCTPFGFKIKKGENLIIPTGITCSMLENQYLSIHPRSGMGFKYRIALANTTGIIDADYNNHIMIKLCYDGIDNISRLKLSAVTEYDDISFFTIKDNETSPDILTIKMGDKIAQGIINNYYITANDDVRKKRNGRGFGSTGR